jgi:hypothetical protein
MASMDYFLIDNRNTKRSTSKWYDDSDIIKQQFISTHLL